MKKVRKDVRGRVLHRGESYIKKKSLFCFYYTDLWGKRKFLYAKDLAESKGLTLNTEATECWDNPITANPDCIYLERDLNARLNRYSGDTDITDVWIWFEDLGNQHYLIYIGYA